MVRPLSIAISMLLLGCVEHAPPKTTKADRKVLERNLLKTAPAPQVAVNALLADKVVYLGLDAPKEARAGRSLKLVHYWQVKKAVGEDWKLFVHVRGAKSSETLNADHVPIKGRYPVEMWKAGDIIRDEHSVTIPRGWDSDAIQITVGLWKGDDRLQVTKGPHDEENRVLAARIPLVKKNPSVNTGKSNPRYLAHKRVGPIAIDGTLTEEDWQKAPSSGDFVETLSGAPAESRASAKVLWDDQFVYVAFDVEDHDIVATLKKHDDKLWTQDVVEMFIDANGDGKDYVELQVSPARTTFDSYLPEVRKNRNSWESGVKAAVKVDGTLNKPEQDRGYTVEMRIPVDAVRGNGGPPPIARPGEPGATWRVNWFRMDGEGKAQKASGWSAPKAGDFHVLERFGELRFIDQTKGGGAGAAVEAIRVKGLQKKLRERRQRAP